MEFCQNIPTRFWASFLLIFWIETFFQMPLENFLWTLHVQGIWEVRLTYSFASVKKSWPHDAPIRFYVKKSEKSWDFEKMKLKIGLEYSDKTSFFEVKLSFQRLWNFFVEFTNKFKVF